MQCKEHKINQLSNGAGKTFLSKLFDAIQLDISVRTSTTTDSRRDWCGVRIDVGKESLVGVVDLAIVKEGRWLMVGEVKGDGTKGVACGVTGTCPPTEWTLALW